MKFLSKASLPLLSSSVMLGLYSLNVFSETERMPVGVKCVCTGPPVHQEFVAALWQFSHSNENPRETEKAG